MLRGLNWGHRRALAPMEAAAEAARAQGIDVAWDVQSLAGFEHGLTRAVAERYDLVVFDHPFAGAVAASQLMLPLDSLLGRGRDHDFAGASLASYCYAGSVWALPVDAATQCAVYRPDLIDAPPTSWDEVITLGTALRRNGRWLGLASVSPHGILALLALCANLGAPLAQDPWAEPFDVAVLREAAGLLQAVHRLARPDGARMNAIDLHEAMVAGDDIAYAPLAYAYLTYAESDQRRPLRFAPFAGPRGSVDGTVLGGTGLGVSAYCRDVPQAMRFVRWLAEPVTQVACFMRHHGQPGCAAAWHGCAEDANFAGAHAAIRDTLEHAWMRPRFPGYIDWQAHAGRIVEAYLAETLTLDGLVAALCQAWHDHAPDIRALSPP